MTDRRQIALAADTVEELVPARDRADGRLAQRIDRNRLRPLPAQHASVVKKAQNFANVVLKPSLFPGLALFSKVLG